MFQNKNHIYRDTKLCSTQKVKLTIPGIQSTIARSAKNQENLTHYEEKRNQSIKTDQEKIKMVQSDKDIKIDITALPMFKKLEERLKRHRTQKMLKKKKRPKLNI